MLDSGRHMRETYKIAVLSVFLGVVPSFLCAQDAAESAAASGHSSLAARNIKTPTLSTRTESKSEAPKKPEVTGKKKSTSPNLVLSTGASPAETNRKALESDSGKHAARLLLRSTPDDAEVFVNDLTVGRTPLLLLVAPGKYKVSMRGERQESGDQTVGAMPDETQVVLIHLKSRYPTSITLH
jgi:hypothetical protein